MKLKLEWLLNMKKDKKMENGALDTGDNSVEKNCNENLIECAMSRHHIDVL